MAKENTKKHHELANELYTRKGENQQNYQKTKDKTVIINGINYTNVPMKIRQEIELLAKMYGTHENQNQNKL